MGFGETGAVARTEGLPASGFDERCFRFSVRCDRDTAHRIERAAKKAGLSPTSFVQRHFETILAPAEPISAAAAGAFDPIAFAVRHEIPLAQARLYGALAARRSADGYAAASLGDLAEATGADTFKIVRHNLARLVHAGLLERADERPGERGVYRLLGDF